MTRKIAAIFLVAGCTPYRASATLTAPPESESVAAPTTTSPVVWSPAIAGPRRSDLDDAFDAPLQSGWDVHDTRTSHKRHAGTCRQLLELNRNFEPDEPGENEWNRYQSNRVRCQVVAALKNAKPARAGHLGAFALDNVRLDELPASVIPAASPDEARRIDRASAKGASWKEVDPRIRVTKTNATEVFVESKTTRCFLRISGHGDFDGDGVEDLILWRSGGDQEGTWATTDAFVLTKRTRGGRLEVIKTLE